MYNVMYNTKKCPEWLSMVYQTSVKPLMSRTQAFQVICHKQAGRDREREGGVKGRDGTGLFTNGITSIMIHLVHTVDTTLYI